MDTPERNAATATDGEPTGNVVVDAPDMSARLSGLTDACRAIAGVESLTDLLRVVTESAQQLIGTHQAVTTRLVCGWSDATTFVSLSDRYGEYRDFDQVPEGLGVLNAVTRENRPLRLDAESLVQHPEWRGLRDAPGHPPLPDYLAAPLISREGRNIGLIQLSHKLDDSPFDAADEALLVQIAQMASATLEHVELLERERAARAEIEERAKQARLVADVGIALTSADPLARKLARCADAVVEHLGAAFARIWTLDDDVLVLRASAGLYTHLDGPHSRVPLGALKIGRIAADREPHLTNDVLDDERVSDREWARREGMVAFAGYPLVVGNRCIGVLAMFARHTLDESTLRSLEAVSDSVGLGIEQARDAERLHVRTDQLHRLAKAASVINRAQGLDDVLQLVTVAARDIVGAHQAVASLTRGPDWSQAITAVSMSDRYAEWADYDEMPDGSGIYAWVCEQRRPARMTQAELEAHPRWRAFGAAADRHPPMRGWLAVPLTGPDGTNRGIVQLSDRHEGDFTEEDEAIVLQLCEIASAALHKTQVLEDRSRVATALQRSLLPPSLPVIPGLDLGARYQPGTEEVGGDFYDVFPLAGGSWGLVVGDVRGKGPDAASVTALARHSARTAAILEPGARDVLDVMNQALQDSDDPERFCSAAYLRVTPEGDAWRLGYASGGHPSLVLVRAGGGAVELLNPTGPVVGLFPDARYSDRELRLGAGDVVVACTDGITESRRGADQFGAERLTAVVTRAAANPAQAIADSVVEAAERHGTREADDSAVLVLRVVGGR